MTERRYRLVYSATIVVEVDAESPEDARDWARSDVIDQLCDDLVEHEIYIHRMSVVTATVVLDNVDPRIDVMGDA